MIEILTAAGLILACVGLVLGALLRQGTPTPRGAKLGRAVCYLTMLLWVRLVAFMAVLVTR